MTPDTPKYSLKDGRHGAVAEKLLENDGAMLKVIQSQLTFPVTVQEITDLLRQECELRIRLKEVQGEYLTPEIMTELSDKLEAMGGWKCHWLGGLRTVQMFGEYYVHVDDFDNALKYLKLKCEFIERVYGHIGLNGALAWTHEEIGDLAAKHGKPDLAYEAYTTACGTLLHMFGPDHEYYTGPLNKRNALPKA